MHTVGYQFYAFFTIALAGVAAGLLFDLLRVIRSRMGFGGALTMITDLTYWSLMTVVIGGALMLGSWGEWRIYIPTGLLAGAVMYFLMGSPVAVALLLVLYDTIAYLLGLLFWIGDRVIWQPVKTIVYVLDVTTEVAIVGPGRWIARRMLWKLLLKAGMSWQRTLTQLRRLIKVEPPNQGGK